MSSNTKKFGESGAWQGWVELSGDICWEQHGGKWCFKDPNNDRIYFVIEHVDMVECCGSDADNCDQFNDSVRRVDLDEVSESELTGALDCCGIDLDEYTPEQRDLVLVEALTSYGVAAPMSEHSDPHYPMRARAEARRAVEEFIADDTSCERALDRPVNRVGSTARDFQRGDVLAGLVRYELEGKQGTDPGSDLMLKMYGGTVLGR